VLTPLGVELGGVSDDTLIAAYVIDPTRSKYELNDLARETVGAEGGGPPYEVGVKPVGEPRKRQI